jgi:hypothetical protein
LVQQGQGHLEDFLGGNLPNLIGKPYSLNELRIGEPKFSPFRNVELGARDTVTCDCGTKRHEFALGITQFCHDLILSIPRPRGLSRYQVVIVHTWAQPTFTHAL